MILKGTSDNNVVTAQGANWLYKSDEPIKHNKFYFEVIVHSQPNYATGCIGINDFTGKYGYTYTNFQGVTPFVVDSSGRLFNVAYWCTSSDYEEITPQKKLNGIGKVLGYGYTLKQDGTTVDYYIDGELIFSHSSKIVFDAAKTYVATFNTWSHNSQNATYYFGSDVKYKAIASKYGAGKKLYLCNDQLFGVK